MNAPHEEWLRAAASLGVKDARLPSLGSSKCILVDSSFPTFLMLQSPYFKQFYKFIMNLCCTGFLRDKV